MAMAILAVKDVEKEEVVMKPVVKVEHLKG